MAEDQQNGAPGEEPVAKVTELHWPTAFTPDVLNRMLAPFPADEVEFRVQGKPGAKGNALALAYIDARAVMRRLDETVGPGNWSFDWEPLTQNCMVVKGRLTVLGVTKCDCGEHEAGGGSTADPVKSAVSDALKRCAVHFGIGRFLYYLGNIWAAHDGRRFTVEPQIKQADLANACRIIGYVGPVKFPPRSVRRSLDEESTPAPAAPRSADASRTHPASQGGPSAPPPDQDAPAPDEAPDEAPRAPAPAKQAAPERSDGRPTPERSDGKATPERSDGKLSQDQLRAVVDAINKSMLGKEVRTALQEKLGLTKFNPTELPAIVTVGDEAMEVVAFVNGVVAEVKAARPSVP